MIKLTNYKEKILKFMLKFTKDTLLWIIVSITVFFLLLISISLIVNSVKYSIDKNNIVVKPEKTYPVPPAREFRGVWMSRFDYTRTLNTFDPDSIKRYISQSFRKYKDANFNSVFFQVRGNGDAFYKSKYEPWSNFLTGKLGKDPRWDPLEFAVKEAQKNGLEIHAWINTFPAWRGKKSPPKTTPLQPYLRHLDWIVCDSSGLPMPKSNHYVSFSPGIPEVHDYIIKVVADIIDKYDIDGIHFDYIRYPDQSSRYGYSGDPISEKRFNSLEANPLQLSRDDWQRQQVTDFIAKAYNAIVEMKPQTKVSAAVIGHYDEAGWNGYHRVFQDARRWAELGKIDMIIPMIYSGMDEGRFGFLYFVDQGIKKYNTGRLIIPGLGVYRLSWEEVLSEIIAIRKNNIPGCVMFAASSLDNGKFDTLKTMTFRNPAKIPCLPWKKSSKPVSPQNFTLNECSLGIDLNWEPLDNSDPENEVYHYVIYRTQDTLFSMADSENILAILPGDTTYYLDKLDSTRTAYYYSITALDFAENESDLSAILKAEEKSRSK